MTFLKSLRRTAAIAGTLTLGAGVVFAQGTPAPSGSADGSAVAAPADMAQKPDTAMAKQNNKTALSDEEVQKILDNAEATAKKTASMKGLRTTDETKRACRHHIFVVDRNGNILGKRSMDDAWTGSLDIALGKARTAAFFSSDENALSSRDIGVLSQAHGEDGTGKAGPLWGIADTNQGTGESAGDVKRNSIVTFPGGLPLYKSGHLVGGVGVSGDGVDQDEAVAFGGAKGFMPGSDVGVLAPLKAKSVDEMPSK